MSRKSFKHKPYITNGIKVSIRRRNKLFKKYLNNPNDVNKAAWKRLRNKISELIKRAEQLYYKKLLSGHNNSSKTLWNTFGKILNSKKIKHLKIASINTNGTIQTEPQAISETFNKFFSEIGVKLAKTFPNENNPEYKNYLDNSVNHRCICSTRPLLKF